jgi:hypothetical protein
MSNWYWGSFVVLEADNSPPSSANFKSAQNNVCTPLYGFMTWCLIKHCTLPQRVYNCIGILSVRKLAPKPDAGVSTVSDAVGNCNLMPHDQQAVQPWKVKLSDIMETTSGHTAKCKCCSKIHDIN